MKDNQNERHVFDIYLLPNIFKILRERKILNIVRVYTDSVEEGTIKSRFGYEGSKWYFPEEGKFANEYENLFIFPDNTAKKLRGRMGVDVIAPCMYEDAAGKKVRASGMPIWAARNWAQVYKVGQPKRVSELTNADILSLGFEQISDYEIRLGGEVYNTQMGLKHVFKVWWDTNMGGWRLIKKHRIPDQFVCYPYSEDSVLDDTIIHVSKMPELPTKIEANPYVIIYTVKLDV